MYICRYYAMKRESVEACQDCNRCRSIWQVFICLECKERRDVDESRNGI